MAKIKMEKGTNEMTWNRAFSDFIICESAEGIKSITITAYQRHFYSAQKQWNAELI